MGIYPIVGNRSQAGSQHLARVWVIAAKLACSQGETKFCVRREFKLSKYDVYSGGKIALYLVHGYKVMFSKVLPHSPFVYLIQANPTRDPLLLAY